MPLRVLVAGRSGQVAQSLSVAASQADDIDLICMGRPELDIADKDSVAAAMEAVAPDLVINAAAYTAVDQAEDEHELAFAANEAGPRHLADVTADQDCPLIHLSTDYVFDGSGTKPYREPDSTAPLGVYGASKLAGEQAIQNTNPKHLIFRTAWIYGAYGKNFLKTMLRVASSNDVLRVVDDQRGAPTSSETIASTLLAAARSAVDGRAYGLYHLTSTGEATWADFAAAIFEESQKEGGPSALVERISTAEYPTKAKRPAYSVLDTSKLASTFGIELPHWRNPVGSVVSRVLQEGSFA